MEFPRLAARQIQAALKDTPVVLIQGPRQSGKSWLAMHMAQHMKPVTSLTLDDVTVLARAKADPGGFLAGFRDQNLIIDEIQRLPELTIAIKYEVDRDRRPGRFLLTGSARLLELPKLADSLAGRIDIITLWPLSQFEIENVERLNPVDVWFTSGKPSPGTNLMTRADLMRRIVRGGFPEAVTRSDLARRATWFENYLSTMLQRDVRETAQLEHALLLPRLFGLLAAQAGSPLNVQNMASTLEMPRATLQRYLAVLKLIYAVEELPPWFAANHSKRLTKSPKLSLTDTGLMAHLLQQTEQNLLLDSPLLGGLLESFVMMELRKLAAASIAQPQLFHMRSYDEAEVDVVLEQRGGAVIGIEVKATSNPGDRALGGLRKLAELSGSKFLFGMVLYTGSQVLPAGDHLWLVPIAALWQ